MCGFDDRIEDYMERLCDCESYHICEWHQRLKAGENRWELEKEMELAYVDALYEDYLSSHVGEPELE